MSGKTVVFRLAIGTLFLASGLAFAGAEVTGVPNFHKVNDHVYRGAQPTDGGFKSLAAVGVKTIIDLRGEGGRSREEESVVKAAGMRYVSLPMRGLGAPPADEMAKILALLDDPSTGPVFLHCKRGADRTGTVVACYRIKHDRWDNQKALNEARSFGMSWVERAMQHYVLHYGPSPAAPAVESNSVAMASAATAP